jgi:spore germination protein YaaH
VNRRSHILINLHTKWKNIFIYTAAACLLFCSAASAATDERAVKIVSADGTPIASGGGLYINGDLWVSEDVMKAAGVQLTNAANGKGFTINVADPAETLGIDALSTLAGNSLSLYFPAYVSRGAKYFNATGMEAITGLDIEDRGGQVCLRPREAGEQLPARVPAPGPIHGRISLTWEYVSRISPNIAAEQKIDGLDILSPTWFNLMDENGDIANRASASYVDAAHRKGYSVWALVSNSFSSKLSAAFFKNQRGMDLFIARLLAYAKLYGFDGINIDFEAMSANNRDDFTALMEKLGPYLNAQGIAFSIDVHRPANTNSSRSHDRAALAQCADYIMVMTYDQHWRTSPVAGSVASLAWVRDSLKKTLNEGVPSKKLLLGVPFYMRLWEETPVTGGKPSVHSKTLTMAQADALMASKGVSPMWLEEHGQNYFEYKENGKTYKVWVEDPASVGQKLKLVDEFSLAGMAAWRRGQEKPSVWQTVKESLKK